MHISESRADGPRLTDEILEALDGCAEPRGGGGGGRASRRLIAGAAGNCGRRVERGRMTQFSANPHRHDPYKQFKFKVRWDGAYVAGVSRVSRLRRATEVVRHREGGDPSLERRSPGRTGYDPITLERGLSHDPAFEQWANKVWLLGAGAGAGAEASLKDFRKDIVVELFNEAGQKVMAFKVFRCWPSEYVALGDLEANGAAVAFESLTLEHEGWERDHEVTEPQEPSFTEPAA